MKRAKLEPGDEQTGFEIIASLPLEEQIRLRVDTDVNNKQYVYINFHTPIYLTQIYTWNGESWEK